MVLSLCGSGTRVYLAARWRGIIPSIRCRVMRSKNITKAHAALCHRRFDHRYELGFHVNTAAARWGSVALMVIVLLMMSYILCMRAYCS